MLRFNLGVLEQDPVMADIPLDNEEKDEQELVRKSQKLAQQTILENCQLQLEIMSL